MHRAKSSDDVRRLCSALKSMISQHNNTC